jgi:hypothetical protein
MLTAATGTRGTARSVTVEIGKIDLGVTGSPFFLAIRSASTGISVVEN